MRKRPQNPQGLTSAPPTPQPRPMPGMAGGRMNRQDRMRYAELSKGDNRINRQDRRFMNQFEQQRSGQIPPGSRPLMPQRPQPQQQPPGGNLAGPVQGQQGPMQDPNFNWANPWGQRQPSIPMPNNIGDYFGSYEPIQSQFNRPAYGGFGNQMMGGYGNQMTGIWNPMAQYQQYRNGGGWNGGQGQ